MQKEHFIALTAGQQQLAAFRSTSQIVRSSVAYTFEHLLPKTDRVWTGCPSRGHGQTTCRGSLLTCPDGTGGGTVAELLTSQFLVLSKDIRVRFFLDYEHPPYGHRGLWCDLSSSDLADTWTANTQGELTQGRAS